MIQELTELLAKLKAIEAELKDPALILARLRTLIQSEIDMIEEGNSLMYQPTRADEEGNAEVDPYEFW